MKRERRVPLDKNDDVEWRTSEITKTIANQSTALMQYLFEV